MDRVEINDEKGNKWFFRGIILVTLVLLYFAYDIKFEDDLAKLNFYPERVKEI